MDSFLLFVRVVLALAVVLGLIWYTQKRLGRGQAGPEKLITVVTRQGLSQKASVVMVDADGTRFMLGVTEQSVTVLHTAVAPPRPVAVIADPALTTVLPGTPDLLAGSIFSAQTWKQAAAAMRDASGPLAERLRGGIRN
ncbi:MAG TPA: flagellar biosynthetic protein FliO [Arthrobacter sp.]